MAQDHTPQPYSYLLNAPEDVARRAAILARWRAGVSSTSASASAARAMPANVAAAAVAAAAAARRPNSAAPGPVAGTSAEDAAQDGGDAIDTFSTYIPTALPPCIINALQEIAAAKIIARKNNDDKATATEVGNNDETASSVSAGGLEQDVIDLLDDDDSNLPAGAVSTKNVPKPKPENSIVNAGDAGDAGDADAGDHVIELLDTDNEDSQMGVDNKNDNDNGNAESKSNNDVPNANSNAHHVDDKPTSNNQSNDNEKNAKASASTSTSTSTTTSSALFTTIQSHTSPAVESALLSSVSVPPIPDDAATTILPLVKEGKLSPLQAEGVTLAINRFRRVFTKKGNGRNDGYMRAGFFIGDGAGIGKGRQISATLLDALCRNHGRGRHLWISVSRELVQDAKRDLADVGCHADVHDGADVLDQMQGGKKGKGLGAGGSLGKGVLFITYSLLVSGKRMEDITSWLAGGSDNVGAASSSSSKKASLEAAAKVMEKSREQVRMEQAYTGVIVFDEAHKAKNLEADTRTAKLVLALQERLPNARILYCSATGVSDIKHMVYAARLGLWGSANPLYPTFDAFRGTLEKRGVGAMEMLALEMKGKGIFLARTLSWDGAEFHTLEVKLSKEQIARYDGAVQWWFSVKDKMNAALQLMSIPSPKTMWRTYWSAHQRFFREMCICSKVDEVTQQALKYLENGDHAIVIGLQSTGEAGMEVALEELADSVSGCKIGFEDMNLSGLVSTSASIMTNFVRNHFPVALPPPEMPKVPDIPPTGFASVADQLEHMRLSDLADRIRNEPPPEPIPQLVQCRNAILESIRDLDLPPNPLDDIIDRLGGEANVAEMTGRSGRILRNKKSGKYRYVKRFGSSQSKQKSYGLSMPVSREDENDRLNVVEKRKFMEGKKAVAIISDAASTGISLHSDRRCKSSHKRRVHFTIELPWAADKAIQQLGRSHRSGQETAPIYKMVVTELGGERRFASAVSKRMAQLGALTKGDRRAATGTDLSEFDVDSIFGRRALSRMYAALSEQPISAPSRNSNDILDKFVADGEIDAQFMEKNGEAKRASALAEAANALVEVGLEGDPNVKKFLNRIAGLDVARQNLVFSLFMATLDDVVTDAKATGEFEGSVEDVRASRVMLKSEPEVIAMDTSCGAKTELTTLIIDRGISFDSMVQTVIDGHNTEGNKSSSAKEKDVTSDEEEEEQCKSGFYKSKRKIAGRHLMMFAQKKVTEEEGIDRDFIDPLNLMIISRPNTGKNPCEMPSQALKYKYKLLVSSSDILNHVDVLKKHALSDVDREEKTGDDKSQPQDAVNVVRSKWGSTIADLWDDAYENSNFKEHNNGLAPRISEIGLITGAVLHVLPALEKAVQFMPQNQRSLRVMRVELTDSGKRIVGIKFPVTKEAIDRLTMGMKEVADARHVSLDSPSFVDEHFSPVDKKAMSWATTEKKTMKSFFGAATSKRPCKSNAINTNGGGKSKPEKRKESSFFVSTPVPNSRKENKKKAISIKGPAKKKSKTTSISSFFGKKNSF